MPSIQDSIEISENDEYTHLNNSQIQEFSMSLLHEKFNSSASIPGENGVSSVNFEILSKEFGPRSYQKDLFFRSLKENVIIVLQTGAGKTLIASMIVEYYGLKEAQDNKSSNWLDLSPLDRVGAKKPKRMLTFFLCNTSALVDQQGKVLQKSTSRSLKIYKSGGKHSGFSKKQWEGSFTGAEVHVMTHQILLNCLRRGFVSMDGIKLIIFDECHHSRKNSPYNRIMREFYDLLDFGKRPRVIGLTASTTNATEDIVESVKRLQQSLDSVVHTADDDRELRGIQSDTNYVVLGYTIENTSYKKWIGKGFFLLIGIYEELAHFKPQIEYTLTELGFFAGTVSLAALYVELKNSPHNIFPKLSNPNTAIKHSGLQTQQKRSNFNLPQQKTAENSFDSKELHRIGQVISFLGNVSNGLVSYTTHNDKGSDTTTKIQTSLKSFEDLQPSITLNQNEEYLYVRKSCCSWGSVKDQLSPKVNALLGYLIGFKNYVFSVDGEQSNPLSAIVFVNRQSTAYILSLILGLLKEFDFIRSEPFVGSHTGNKNGIVRLLNNALYKKGSRKTTYITDTLQRFRLGKINLLVATQVAEEGLDISLCNLVIRFDPALTLTNFIQARGRARDKNSVYVVMVPEDSVDSSNLSSKLYPSNPCSKKKKGKNLKRNVDKNSHRFLNHYESLFDMESSLKNAHSFTNHSGPNDFESQENDLVIGRLSKQIISNPTNLNVDLELISHMKIKTLAPLNDKSVETLRHIATELATYAKFENIDEVYFKVFESGAQLTTQSVISVINDYVQSVAKDASSNSKVEFKLESMEGKGSFCTVTFPEASMLKLVSGPFSKNGKVSRKAALLFACISLYYFGALDSHLMPISTKPETATPNIKIEVNGSSYQEINNILNTLNCTKIYYPSFDKLDQANSNKTSDKIAHVPSTTHESTSRVEKNISSASVGLDLEINTKKRELEEETTTSNKSAKKKATSSNNKTISFQEYNPKNWKPPKIIEDIEYSASVRKKIAMVEAYAYACNLNHTTAYSEGFSSQIDNNAKVPAGFQLLFFFTKPLPENMVVPLYLNENSAVPVYYKFDPIPAPLSLAHQAASNMPEDGLFFDPISNTASEEVSNKVRFSIKQWKDLAAFTSSLYSLLVQREFRLNPKLASYVLALPAKDYSTKLDDIYRERDCGRMEILSLDPSVVNFELKRYYTFTQRIPIFTTAGIDWQAVSSFTYDPIRLSNFPVKEWSELLNGHFIISDYDKFHVCEYIQTMKGTTVDSNYTKVLAGLKKIQNEAKLGTEATKSGTFFGEKASQENLQLKSQIRSILSDDVNLDELAHGICSKAKSIRVLDYLYQSSSINHDLLYEKLLESELFVVKTINYRFNYLTNSANDVYFYQNQDENPIARKDSNHDTGQHNSLNSAQHNNQDDGTNFISLKMIQEFSRLAKNDDIIRNNSTLDRLDDIRRPPQPFTLQLSDVDEKEQEKVDFRKFLEIALKLKPIIAIPALTRIIPFTKQEFLKLAVLPSLTQRLHSMLIQNDLFEAFELPVTIGSTRFQSNQEKLSKNDCLYANESAFAGYFQPKLNEYCTLSSNGFMKSKKTNTKEAFSRFKPGESGKFLQGDHHYATQEYDSNYANKIKSYAKYNTSPSWLIRTSLTYQSAAEDVNYQRLEILGDSVLKVLMATQLFAGLAPTDSDEGILSHYGSLLVSNSFLAKITKKIGLYYGLWTIKFEKKDWVPPGLGWKRLNYPLVRTIPYNAQPWGYFRGCPEIINEGSEFADQFDFSTCKCKIEPLEVREQSSADTNQSENFKDTRENVLEPFPQNLVGGTLDLQKKLETTSEASAAKVLSTANTLVASNLEVGQCNFDSDSDSDSVSVSDSVSGCIKVSLEDLRYYASLDKSLHNNASLVQTETTHVFENLSKLTSYSDYVEQNENSLYTGLLNFSSSSCGSSKEKTMDTDEPDNCVQNLENKSATTKFTLVSDYTLLKDNVKCKNKAEPNTSDTGTIGTESAGVPDTKLHKTDFEVNKVPVFRSPLPSYYFFPSKKPKERTKPRSPYHKQHFKPLPDKLKFVNILPKTQADLVEAILGVSFKLGKMDAAFLSAKAFGIVNTRWNCWADMASEYSRVCKSSYFYNVFGIKLLEHNYTADMIHKNDLDRSLSAYKHTVDQLERILGYRFKNPALCIEAVTHGSVADSTINSYERLEFLGDSILSVVTTSYYYDQIDLSTPLSIHLITILKHVAVSNDVLGLIAYLHNFIDFLRVDSQSIVDEITDYKVKIGTAIDEWRQYSRVNRIHESCDSSEPTRSELGKISFKNEGCHLFQNLAKLYEKEDTSACLNSVDDFHLKDLKKNKLKNVSDSDKWLDIPHELWRVANPPKIMGDLVESLLGAVYTDSGFSLSSVTTVVEKVYSPFIRSFIGPHQVTLNSVIQFGLMIQSTGCGSYKYLIMSEKQAINDAGILNLISKNKSVYGKDIDIAFDVKAYQDSYRSEENININDEPSTGISNNDKEIFVCFIVAHSLAILGHGYGSNSKRAKSKAAEFAVSNWDKPSGNSTTHLLKKSCNCASKRDFDPSLAYACLMKE